MAKNEEMFSMSYEDAKKKYGTGLGNNKMFMPKETFTKKQAELNKTKQEEKPKNNSLVADKFGDKKEKTYEDVKRENGNDPKKMAEWLNNNPSYKAGNLTKKGMEEFGYAQGADGKWSIKQPTTEDTTAATTDTTTATTDTTTADTDTTTTKPTTVETTSYTPDTETPTTTTTPTTATTDTTTTTTDTTTTEGVNKDLEKLKKENEDLKKELEKYTDKKGKVDKDAAFASMDQYHQRMIETGAATIDKNGKFKLKPVGKGWETWATLLSAGVSAVGLAMGIPIPPINFRKLTGKNEKDEQARKQQQQYLDILSDNYAKVEGMKADIKAGEEALKNQEALTAQEKHAQATAATKDVISAQTDAEEKLINKKLEAEMILVNEDFKNKIGEMKISHEQKKDLETLMSNLSTDSAKELLNQERYGYILKMAEDMKAAGMDDKAIALKLQSLAGNTPTAQNIEHAQKISKIITDIVGTVMSGKGNENK